ncbi:hypothetical protein C0992_009144, partial [Termitomyces sp. T32_za158]
RQIFKTAKALAAEEQKVIKASKKTGKSKTSMQAAPSDAGSDLDSLPVKATRERSISSDEESLPPVLQILKTAMEPSSPSPLCTPHVVSKAVPRSPVTPRTACARFSPLPSVDSKAINIADTSLLDPFPGSVANSVASDNFEDNNEKKPVLRSCGHCVYVSDNEVLSLSDSDPGTHSKVSVVTKSSFQESNMQSLSANFPASKDQQYVY